MKARSHLAALPAVLMLAGCVPGTGLQPPPDTPDNSRGPGGDACGASEMQHLVGNPLPADLSVSGPVRVFGPDDALTMDMSHERLNIELDADRRMVTRVFCG